MAFLTFVAEDPDGGDLGEVSVAVYDAEGRTLADSTFAPYFPGELPRTIQLEPGSYSLWVRVPDWIFPWPTSLTVVIDEGPSPAEPRIVTLTASGQVQPEELGALPVIVFGYALKAPPGTEEGLAAGGYGILRTGRSGAPVSYRNSVQLTQLGPSALGEVATLVQKGRVTLSPDRSGYWEVPLRQGTLYRISLPGVVGSRIFRTPDASDRVDVNTLIEASLSSPPYDLVS